MPLFSLVVNGGTGGSHVGNRAASSPYFKSVKSLGSGDDGPKTKWEEMASRAVGRSWLSKKVSGPLSSSKDQIMLVLYVLNLSMLGCGDGRRRSVW